MPVFIDPREDPLPDGNRPRAPTTRDRDELTELLQLCREGRLYEIEQWIRAGRPLQLKDAPPAKGRHIPSPLEIALEAGSHALVFLLLCNGYDPTLEPDSPLDLALQARRWDLLDLLLEWGADPHRVELEDLFGTYRSDLFERFRALGVDLTDRHAIAWTLAEHTSNKPLFGFAKRHRKEDPTIQRELDTALAHHAGEANEKGVALSLWAGADPHAPVCNLRWGCDCGKEDADDDDETEGDTAIERACRKGNLPILKRLGPDPERDNFDALYREARTETVVAFLTELALPEDADAVIRHHIWAICFDLGLGYRPWSSVRTLRRLFEAGVRWKDSSKEAIANVRRLVLGASDRAFIDLLKLLAEDDYCSPEILKELARTPAMRRRMKEVGFIPPDPEEETRRNRFRRSRPRPQPTRSREVRKKFGVEPKKPAKGKDKSSSRQLPRSVWIGSRRRGRRELRLDRKALFERVLSEPVSVVAKEWGLSDQGLRKACRRLQVPVPPRGYWAKRRAGHRVRRPRLPKLPEGQAEEVVVWVGGVRRSIAPTWVRSGSTGPEAILVDDDPRVLNRMLAVRWLT